jgi:hypothetical protein
MTRGPALQVALETGVPDPTLVRGWLCEGPHGPWFMLRKDVSTTQILALVFSFPQHPPPSQPSAGPLGKAGEGWDFASGLRPREADYCREPTDAGLGWAGAGTGTPNASSSSPSLFVRWQAEGYIYALW